MPLCFRLWCLTGLCFVCKSCEIIVRESAAYDACRSLYAVEWFPDRADAGGLVHRFGCT